LHACREGQDLSGKARRLSHEGRRGEGYLHRKAKNLAQPAGSYFLATAAFEHRTRELIRCIADIDFIETETEVEACSRKPAHQGHQPRSTAT
jgi:hypothetical protein